MKSKVSELAAYNELIILFSLDKLARESTSEEVFVYADNFFESIVIRKATLAVTLSRMIKKKTIYVVGKTSKRLRKGGKRRKKYAMTKKGRQQMCGALRFMKEMIEV